MASKYEFVATNNGYWVKAGLNGALTQVIDSAGTWVGGGGVITNINGEEFDSVTTPTTETGVYAPTITVWCHVNNEIGAVKILDAAPFKMILVQAWSQNTSSDGGTWKLLDNASADMTDVVTAAAVDNDVDFAGKIIDAASTIGAGEDLYVSPRGTLDAYIFATFMRID